IINLMMKTTTWPILLDRGCARQHEKNKEGDLTSVIESLPWHPHGQCCKNCLRQRKSPRQTSMFSCHHQDSAMVLFTKVYGELSLRFNKACRDAITAAHFKRMQERPSVKKRLAYEK